MPESWTILKVLDWTADRFAREGIDAPRVDAEVLLAHVLELERIQLYAHFDQPLQPHGLTAYRERVKRRLAREPVAYITGAKEFWSLALQVTRDVLIPRPETELLVESALERLDAPGEGSVVVDVGTGSGAVALAVKKERPAAAVTGTDLSGEALDVARRNAEAHGLEIMLLQGDLLDALPDGEAPTLILSNPPYVADGDQADLAPEIRDWEPRGALFAGPDGLAVIRRLAEQAFERLAAGGWLMVEIGCGQGEAASGLLAEAGFAEVDVRKDLAGLDRVVLGRKG